MTKPILGLSPPSASPSTGPGAGEDTFNYTVGDGADTIDGGLDTKQDALVITGTAGNDTVAVVWSGAGVISGLAGGTVTNVEEVTLNLGIGTGDTLSYAGTSANVTATIGDSASGFTSNIAC